MTQPLNLGTFQDYLNTYGADLNKWPEELRAQAEDILKDSKEAQEAYVEALKLDKLFEGSNDKGVPDELFKKIMRNIDS